jgi:hypothetical protein
LGIFVLTRLVDAVAIAMLARHQIAPPHLASGVQVPTVVDPPSYLSAVQGWDGQWYRQIVEHGYPSTLPSRDGVVEQSAWAFYPGFPALVWLVMRTGLSFAVAASLVSLASGAAAMCVLYRLVIVRGTAWLAGVSVLAFCCAPAAPVMQVAYSESLGLLLLFLGLRLLDQGRYGWLAVTGLALALTRPVTAPLAVAAFVVLVVRWRTRDRQAFPPVEQRSLVAATVALVLSAGLWPLVTGLVVGDVSAYSDTQHAWRLNGRYTWLGSLLHGAPLARWLFVLLVAAGFVGVALRNTRWGTGTRTWVAAYPLYMFAVTPATSSIFRYLLMIGPGMWPSSVTDPSRRARVTIVVLVTVLGLAVQLLWLRWYFVITPASEGTP